MSIKTNKRIMTEDDYDCMTFCLEFYSLIRNFELIILNKMLMIDTALEKHKDCYRPITGEIRDAIEDLFDVVDLLKKAMVKVEKTKNKILARNGVDNIAEIKRKK